WRGQCCGSGRGRDRSSETAESRIVGERSDRVAGGSVGVSGAGLEEIRVLCGLVCDGIDDGVVVDDAGAAAEYRFATSAWVKGKGKPWRKVLADRGKVARTMVLLATEHIGDKGHR